MLEGKNVNLRIVEKEDLPLVAEWFNNPEFSSVYEPLDPLQSRTEIEKKYSELSSENKWFFIERKDGNRIGFIGHFAVGKQVEIGYTMAQDERKKGYCTEAVEIMLITCFFQETWCVYKLKPV